MGKTVSVTAGGTVVGCIGDIFKREAAAGSRRGKCTRTAFWHEAPRQFSGTDLRVKAIRVVKSDKHFHSNAPHGNRRKCLPCWGWPIISIFGATGKNKCAAVLLPRITGVIVSLSKNLVAPAQSRHGGFASEQGLSNLSTAVIASLFRGLKTRENTALCRKMPFMDGHYFTFTSICLGFEATVLGI